MGSFLVSDEGIRRADRFALRDALGWLEDCFEDVPANLSPGEIRKAIERHYIGGWRQFVIDGAP